MDCAGGARLGRRGEELGCGGEERGLFVSERTSSLNRHYYFFGDIFALVWMNCSLGLS